MRYINPVIAGFYPDPSVCRANGKYYLVASSFQYFPGIPLFESTDLVNWRQIGHVLTRKSQVALAKARSSSGVFAATIRYHEGRFYVVTTNNALDLNFYVYTDDIYGPWSEPIPVDQGGIDPSLFFEGGRVYFLSNGADDAGERGVTQCEIDIATGAKRTPSRCIWKGTGGRCLEAPHMYHIGNYYYLMAAEGGTEYGHMVVLARGNTPWGPFDNCPRNPVLSNRNKAQAIIQGIGHADMIKDETGEWHLLALGFRQLDVWQAYHILGRETFLLPMRFEPDGWPTVGRDGTAEERYELPGDFKQCRKMIDTFENTDFHIDWCRLRHPVEADYKMLKNRLILHGSSVTLDDAASPTFIALRQRGFCLTLSVKLALRDGEGGVTVYTSETAHYDLAIRRAGDAYEAALKLTIGDIVHTRNVSRLDSCEASLIVRAEPMNYHFFIQQCGEERALGSAQSKYLSSEVDGGFTGVMLGLYAVDGCATFTHFSIEYASVP